MVRNWSTHVVVLQKASLFFLSACRFVPVNFRLPKIPPLSTNCIYVAMFVNNKNVEKYKNTCKYFVFLIK